MNSISLSFISPISMCVQLPVINKVVMQITVVNTKYEKLLLDFPNGIMSFPMAALQL